MQKIRRVFGLSVCLFTLFSCATSHQDVSTSTLLIYNTTVIDSANGLRAGQDVTLVNDRIHRVQATQPLSDYSYPVIDGTGSYLIPGLWDAHVHLTFDDKVTDSMNRLFIGNGITSVRDTGGLLSKVLAFRDHAKSQVAPSIYLAGPLLDGEPTVYNGSSAGFPSIANTVASPEAGRAMVNELADAGVDLIKAYEMLSPQTFRAVLDQAQKRGLPVTGHVPLSMTAEQASAAGLNSMEHLRNLEMGCSAEEDALLSQRQALLKNDDELLGSKLRSKIHALQHVPAIKNYDAQRCQNLIRALAKYDTWQVPTLALSLLFTQPYFGDPEWQQNYASLPPELSQEWLQRSTNIAERFSQPSDQSQDREQLAQWRKDMLRALVKEGVPIMAGTDTPIFFLTPGYSLHLELETLVGAGLTPAQALEAATSAPARYFALDKQLGQIAPDYTADLLLLSANPLDDIRNTRAIKMVVKGGEVFDRAALDNLLRP